MSNEEAIGETLAIGSRLVRDVLSPMKRTFVGKDTILETVFTRFRLGDPQFGEQVEIVGTQRLRFVFLSLGVDLVVRRRGGKKYDLVLLVSPH